MLFYRIGYYAIYCKRFDGSIKYGRSYYDFSEGSLMFMAPHQVLSPSTGILIEEGWGLIFHPDLLNNSALGKKINSYSFFHYDANEALHISEDEKLILKECLGKNRKRIYSKYRQAYANAHSEQH